MTAGVGSDVIVVGGGPAGAAMAWSLAQRGIAVTVLERAEFPREKVCGDFVEPAGLRIIGEMGCADALGVGKRPRIDRMRAYYGPHIAYHERVAYYTGEGGVPPYGHIIPRHELDTALLANAQRAGARVEHGVTVTGVAREGGMMAVSVREKRATRTLTAPVVVGADGVQSVVAQHAGLRREDKRHIGISQRVYLEGIELDESEACIWFDDDHYPGYGWGVSGRRRARQCRTGDAERDDRTVRPVAPAGLSRQYRPVAPPPSRLRPRAARNQAAGRGGAHVRRGGA